MDYRIKWKGSLNLSQPLSEKVKEIVKGSTKFNIEKFMNESEVENYREWLKVKTEMIEN